MGNVAENVAPATSQGLPFQPTPANRRKGNPSTNQRLTEGCTWLDSWAGIGHVAVSMARQGNDLQLTRYDEKGWRAIFYTNGMEHSPTSATGTGWERTPWRATQRAAWEALRKAGAAAGDPYG